jgi:Holliday junction resolvase
MWVMNPLDYEKSVALALQSLGWEASLTPATADFGADVVARCAGETLVVQCKHYGSENYVGFGAIKEVSFAQRHFKGTLAAVIFSGKVSKQARFAAGEHGIMLMMLHELKIGCVLDRTEKGRLHKHRIELEQAAEARRTDRVKLLTLARSLIATEEEWRQYNTEKPHWTEQRNQSLVRLGISLFAAAATLWAIIVFNAGWVAVTLTVAGIWVYFAYSLPKFPDFLEEPRNPRPLHQDLGRAIHFVKEVDSAINGRRVTVTCPGCATFCGVPAGGRINIKCPTCLQIFERDLRAGA